MVNDKMKLIAHITNVEGERLEQGLKDHCLNTADYASGSIGNSSFHNIVYLAGILHDMGKAKREFVEYLEDSYAGKKVSRGSVNHTFAGVIWLFDKFHGTNASVWERLTCEIIGYAIGSHHGMFDCIDLEGRNGFVHRLNKDRKEIHYEEAVQNFLSDVVSEEKLTACFKQAVGEAQSFFEQVRAQYKVSTFFQISMLTRLTLSAVIYGDRRDTAEFMRQIPVVTESGRDALFWKDRRDYLEDKLSQLGVDSELNRVRNDISRQCMEFTQKPEGIYRLNVPTGGGKTLASLRAAMAHAEKYHKKRLIFIIPLLSVLDQNVKVIRDYLACQEDVLEHHSNVVRENTEEDSLDPYELLAESWNGAPIIVSTLVQLLEILFSDKVSAVGRMQALCDSVIVIDEVQSLPKKITYMFNQALNFLKDFCHATIILSSATQPCFEELKYPLHFVEDPDMVKLTREQMRVFERTRIMNRTSKSGMDLGELAGFCCDLMESHASLLTICNTKAEARTLYEKLSEPAEAEGWRLIHLSTAMCQKHRLDVLEALQAELSAVQKAVRGKKSAGKVLCVSTQMMEAGVDLSFESLIRILAGIDNLAQSAGRCNRSNEYGAVGDVYLVNLKNEVLRMLPEIVNAQSSTWSVLEQMKQFPEETLTGEWSSRRFYQHLYREMQGELAYPVRDDIDRRVEQYLFNLLCNTNEAAQEEMVYCLHQPFKTIGKLFKVFAEETTDILVPYGDGKYWIDQLRSLENNFFDIGKYYDVIEQAKPYTVKIYDWQKNLLDQAGLLYPFADGRILTLDEKAYDDHFGLKVVKEQPVEDFIL